MQYAVPQFIEVEDKVIGPLTIRQFLMILGGALISAATYAFFDLELFIFSTIVIMAIAAAFALIKINGQKLEKVVINGFKYFTNPRIRVWARELSKPVERVSHAERRGIELEDKFKGEVTRSKLHDLSALLDTSARQYVTTKPDESKSTSGK